LLAALLVAPAQAGTLAAIPDPASIGVPDLSSADPVVASNGYKFFIFHNSAITYAEAYADIAECRSFLTAGYAPVLPGFIPWVEPSARTPITYNPVGLAAGIAADIIVPKMERGLRNNKMRRCMEPRGYTRFAVPEAAWEQLNKGDEANLVAMQAKLAVGPRPSLTEVSR